MKATKEWQEGKRPSRAKAYHKAVPRRSRKDAASGLQKGRFGVRATNERAGTRSVAETDRSFCTPGEQRGLNREGAFVETLDMANWSAGSAWRPNATPATRLVR